MVVVVDGVMPIQGDGNTVHKAKDYSRAHPELRNALANLDSGESSRARESRMR